MTVLEPEAYARSLIEASLDPLVTISPDGKITDVNQATIEVTGVAKKKLIGTDFSTYFTEPGKAREGYQQVFKTGFVKDYPLTIRSQAGKLVDVLYNASLYKDAGGKVLGVFAAARDVTAQKQASQYARSLIEASLDPLVTISPEGKITDVNEGSVKVTGIPRDTLIGTDFSNYFTEPENARAGYKQVFEKGFVTDYPLTIRHKDGRLTDVLYNASVYKDAGGKVLGVFAAARDVTATRQASAYARSLIEASLDPLVTISPEGKITDVNQSTIRITGLSRGELIGTDFSTYFTEPEKAREGYQQVLAKKFVTDYPLTLRHESGRLIDVLYNASIYKDAAGKVLGVFAAARDVTSQKQASLYARSLIEASVDPLVTISPEGKVTDVNEATVAATGVPRDELVGTDFSTYFTEPKKAREGYRLVFSQGFVKDYPLTVRHASGRLVDVLYNASVYKDVAGKVLGAFAAARDVTERRRAEESVVRLAAVVQSSTDAILTKDLAGNITSWNDACRSIFGYDAAEVLGKSVTLLYPKGSEAAEETILEKIRRGESVKLREAERVRKDGTIISISVSASPLRDLTGTIVGATAIERDVTDRTKSERELEVSRKQLLMSEKLTALGTLVSGVGHEVRTPLTYIVNHLAIIKKLVQNATAQNPALKQMSQDLRAHLEAANEGVGRINKLASQLRQFAQPGLTTAPIGLHEVVGAAVDLFRATRKGDLVVTAQLTTTLPFEIDSGQIQQVIINLLNNAADASAPGGSIEVRVTPADDQATIEVQDHGTGIPLEVQRRLFDPFYTTKKQGTGLGLSICRRIVEAHGGTLRYETELAKGTTFIIRLPRKHVPAQEAKP